MVSCLIISSSSKKLCISFLKENLHQVKTKFLKFEFQVLNTSLPLRYRCSGRNLESLELSSEDSLPLEREVTFNFLSRRFLWWASPLRMTLPAEQTSTTFCCWEGQPHTSRERTQVIPLSSDTLSYRARSYSLRVSALTQTFSFFHVSIECC